MIETFMWQPARCVCNTLQHDIKSLFFHGSVSRSSFARCNTLQHTATHCYTLQHATTHCNALQHTATHCNTLQHAATSCTTLYPTYCTTLHHAVTHCATLHHTASHCTLQQTATHSKLSSHFTTWNDNRFFGIPTLSLTHTYTHIHTHAHTHVHTHTQKHYFLTATIRTSFSCAQPSSIPQHTATHCSTLRHTAAHCSTLQQTTTRCNTLQHTATHLIIWICSFFASGVYVTCSEKFSKVSLPLIFLCKMTKTWLLR